MNISASIYFSDPPKSQDVVGNITLGYQGWAFRFTSDFSHFFKPKKRIWSLSSMKGYDGGMENWCLIDEFYTLSSFRPSESQVQEPLKCNFTGY